MAKKRNDVEDPIPAPVTGSLWHFSDLHFDWSNLPGSPYSGVEHARLGDFAVRPWDALLALARDEPADFLVFSGDFVDSPSLGRGLSAPSAAETPDDLAARFAKADPKGDRRRAVFRYTAELIRAVAQAHGFQGPLHERVLVCPGNHDVDWDRAIDSPSTSLVDFREAMGEFLRPDSDQPRLLDLRRGVAFLTLNTAYLGGTLVRARDGTVFQTDPPAFSPAHVDQVIDRLNRNRGPRSEPLVPGGTLGIVVAHHPPAITPTAEVDVRPFEIAIGAARAKQALHEQGFRAFLHGHKHVGVVHHECVHLVAEDRSDEMVVIGAPAFLGGGGGTPGFHVLRYAVSRVSGEARILVLPYSFTNRVPRPEGERLVVIPPRTRSAARSLRVALEISVVGDSRVDCIYSDIPLPRHRRAEGGWCLEGGKWVRDFARVEEVPRALDRRPLVKVLTEQADYRIGRVEQRDGKRHYSVRIEVPPRSDQDPRPSVSHASFLLRSFAGGAYVISRAHARRYGFPLTVEGLPEGWEAVVTVLRDPAERLEFSLRMPFDLRGDYDADVFTFVELPDGRLRPAPELRAFCRCHVEKHFEAGRLFAAIEHPLSGVAYALGWELPDEDPVVADMEVSERTEYRTALRWAEMIRVAMLGMRGGERRVEAECLRATIEALMGELVRVGAAALEDRMEWTVFVPANSLLDEPRTSEEEGDGSPKLVSVLASYGADDPRWSVDWRVGDGLVGRAYAVNQQMVHRGPHSGKSTAVRNEWSEPNVPYYRRLEGTLDHSVLYALPLYPTGRIKNDIVWGVLCVGTDRPFAALDLDKPVPESEIAPGPRAANASVALLAGLSVFLRALVDSIHRGTPFAAPTAASAGNDLAG